VAPQPTFIPPGDKEGNNLIPLNGQYMAGTYYNINKFILLPGRFVILQYGIYLKILAQEVQILGTLFGAGRGQPGGTGGQTKGGNGSSAGSISTGFGDGGLGSMTGGGAGGGGGAYGGGGGGGGAGGNVAVSTKGGAEIGSRTSMSILQGRGGGGGGSSVSSMGGRGGRGGGAIILIAADFMNITGVITVNGSMGQKGNDGLAAGNDGSGAGGGGSGGGIFIKLNSWDNPMNISGGLYATGGRGGSGGNGFVSLTSSHGGGGGGGGSGGRIKIFINSSFINTSTMNVSGGLGGTGGGKSGLLAFTGQPGQDGANGTIYVHIIPEVQQLIIPVFLITIVALITSRKKGKKNANQCTPDWEVVD
jgi:hypothetical protein